MNATKPSAEQVVISVLTGQPDATVTEIATTGKLGRSTVSKTLTKLESAGKARRSTGKRDSGARRPPDRWSLAHRPARNAHQPATGRLRPGQLDGLVLEHLRKHAKDGPLGPTTLATSLGRSSGAVGNCLKRLAASGKVTQTGEHPRRYMTVKRARAR